MDDSGTDGSSCVACPLGRAGEKGVCRACPPGSYADEEGLAEFMRQQESQTDVEAAFPNFAYIRTGRHSYPRADAERHSYPRASG